MLQRFGLAAAFLLAASTILACTTSNAQQPAPAVTADPLPSWRDSASKKAILDFIRATTTPGSAGFVPPDERIATFDNDGTLWAEQPMYFQVLFALDRIKAMAPQHPEWKDKEPYKSVLSGDHKALAALGERALVEIIMTTHAGMTTDEFRAIVDKWFETARHPTKGRLFTEMVYQPMLEVLAFFRASGYKTFIVSGGGIEFMRAYAQKSYGIPPEQVIGSSGKEKYQVKSGTPVIVKLPEIEFVDDKAGKPLAINRFIGRRPVAAFGNSDGDYEMLVWTTSAPATRFGAIVHHTDAAREWAYDRHSEIGHLAKALDEAPSRGWTVIDMKNDWATIFPPERAK